MFPRPACCARVVAALAALCTLAAAAPARAQCEPHWFAGRGFPGTNGPVYASISWDADGPGGNPPLPVIGGSFNIAGDAFADNVAAWNGSAWIPLGNGVPGTNASVRAFAVYDDGTGPALYVGGTFDVAGGIVSAYWARWGCSAVLGDLDGDGDVDLGDFSTLAVCFNGTGNPPAPACPPGVEADLDGDGDVDLADFATFSTLFGR